MSSTDPDKVPPTKWERRIGLIGGAIVTCIVLYLILLLLIWLTGKATS